MNSCETTIINIINLMDKMIYKKSKHARIFTQIPIRILVDVMPHVDNVMK